jgi:predicted ArsR family transcriptional regulator
MSLKSAIPDTRARVLAAALENPGFGAMRLAHAMGLPMTTVETHMKRLRKDGKLPPPVKRDYYRVAAE